MDPAALRRYAIDEGLKHSMLERVAPPPAVMEARRALPRPAAVVRVRLLTHCLHFAAFGRLFTASNR
jgi:hypothetical protein